VVIRNRHDAGDPGAGELLEILPQECGSIGFRDWHQVIEDFRAETEQIGEPTQTLPRINIESELALQLLVPGT
jgi:hypothetical protein